jgi:hypothetical protein
MVCGSCGRFAFHHIGSLWWGPLGGRSSSYCAECGTQLVYDPNPKIKWLPGLWCPQCRRTEGSRNRTTLGVKYCVWCGAKQGEDDGAGQNDGGHAAASGPGLSEDEPHAAAPPQSFQPPSTAGPPPSSP